MSEEIPLTDMGGPKEPEQGVVPGPAPRQHLNDLMYRRFGCFPYYASPVVQLLMVASICCLLPGGYNALTGVGAAGQSTPTVFDNSTTALYAAFAFASFFSGSAVNRIGIRYSLALGGLGYNLYAGSLLHYNNHPSENSGDFMIAAGVVLGFSAGLLWAAQGTILVSYPPEHQKGRCIALFWCLFNVGAVLATLPIIAWNVEDKSSLAFGFKTYLTFVILSVIGTCLGFFMVNAKAVRRHDGSRVHLAEHPTWKSEFIGLWTTLKTSPHIILLLPMFFASNSFYTYQYNGVNLPHFDVRTRALNDECYWIAQCIAAVIFGFGIDQVRLSRSQKAKVAWFVLLFLTIIVWGGGYAYLISVPDRKKGQQVEFPTLDWSMGRYGGPLVLYMSYGFYDAWWQSTVYWFIGALTNSGRTSAHYVGYYKALQSAGAAIMWRIDALGYPYMVEFKITVGLLLGSLIFALPVVWFIINNTNYHDDWDAPEDVVADGYDGDASNNQVNTASQDQTASSTNATSAEVLVNVPRDELAMSGATMRPRPHPVSPTRTLIHALKDTQQEAQQANPVTPPNRRSSYLDVWRREQ